MRRVKILTIPQEVQKEIQRQRVKREKEKEEDGSRDKQEIKVERS